MKNSVCKRARQEVSKVDIIRINGMAKADMASGNKVINASIGTYLDDNKDVGSVRLINESLKASITDSRGYPGVYGDPKYLDGVLDFIFEDHRKEIEKKYKLFTGATMGGTGACSIAFNLFLDDGEEVLLPDVMWTNYKLIAKKAGCIHRTYHLFNEKNELDLPAIEETIKAAFVDHKHTLFVLNDPCQNPTGYCMTEAEYDRIFDIFERCSSLGHLTVLFDIAYLSFFHVTGQECPLIGKLAKGGYHFLPLIAFSCSKVFGMYGLRCGALIALAKTSDDEDEISRAFGAEARGTYSVPVGTAEAAIANVLKDQSKKAELLAEVKKNSDIVFSRGRSLVKKLDEAGIAHYPYKSGFFITLKVDNAFEIFDKMKERHMYIVPMGENSIRLALSGMTENECIELVDALKEVID